MLLSIGEYYIWENMFCERELKLIYSKHNVFSIDDLWSLCQELYHQVTNRFVMRQCTLYTIQNSNVQMFTVFLQFLWIP